MWSRTCRHELYVFLNGIPIYKRWTTKSGKKTQPSVLFNKEWPNVEIL